MKLPFAVYTARDGYAWQSGTDAGTAKLERLRKAIGKMPEFDFGDTGSSGMLNIGDEIVLYRFMRQEKADSHGRSALYLAMTYFPRKESRFINADVVLSEPPFAEPLKKPPSWFEYKGQPAVPTDFSMPTHNLAGCFNQAGELAAAGFVFSVPFEGSLHISRKEPKDGKGCLFQYKNSLPTTRQDLLRQPEPSGQPYSVPVTDTKAVSIWKWAALAAITLALIEALALIYLVRDRLNMEPPRADIDAVEAPVQDQLQKAAEVIPTAMQEEEISEDTTQQPIGPADVLQEEPPIKNDGTEKESKNE